MESDLTKQDNFVRGTPEKELTFLGGWRISVRLEFIWKFLFVDVSVWVAFLSC